MQRGFTLIETVVVLIIMASIMSLVTPDFTSVSTANEVRAVSRQMTAALRQARSMAIAHRTITAFTLDLEQRTFQVDGGRVVHVPADLDLTLITGQSELHGKGSGTIRFFADGSSTGGRITLSADGNVRQVYVAWLTGRVTTDRVQAGNEKEAS